MNASDFLAQVVEPNSNDLSESPDDIRTAVNAILSADVFFGVVFEEKRNAGKSSYSGDEKYRDAVAAKSECYRALRDTAAALKHGRLDRGNKPRVVRSAAQTGTRETKWNDDGKWNNEEVWADEAVIIEMDDGRRVRADRLVKEVILIAQEELNPTGRAPASLADIASVLS